MKALVIAALALAASAASAEHGRRSVPALPLYTQECGSCHVAFPPGLLPAPSWQRLMGNLKQHFGSDASLEPAATASLSAWLQGNAGRRRGEAPAEDRITRSAWFVREHDEVPADAWRRQAVRNAANCSACHGGAAEGDFDEHRVRIPR